MHVMCADDVPVTLSVNPSYYQKISSNFYFISALSLQYVSHMLSV